MPDADFLLLAQKPALPSVEVLLGEVSDDTDAIKIFIRSYARKSAHTVRSYEKECYRLLLWLRATRAPSLNLLPTVTVRDINDYLDFVANPRPFPEDFLQQQGWTHQPFRKALGVQSTKHCITVLHKLFAALRELRSPGNLPYCMFNPVTLAYGGIAGSHQPEDVEQALSEVEWQAVQEAIENLPRASQRDAKHYHRARWVMQLLYRAFLRREEAANLTMGSFESSPQGWSIRLLGKGQKKAKIIATNRLMDELKIYRTSLGLPALPSPGETRSAILAVTGKDKGVTAQAIYLVCKVIFNQAADLLESQDPVAASRLRQASPHWMRHTGVTHAMEGGVNPRYVQAQARHSSLNVTARYDHQQKQAWRAALESSDASLTPSAD